MEKAKDLALCRQSGGNTISIMCLSPNCKSNMYSFNETYEMQNSPKKQKRQL